MDWSASTGRAHTTPTASPPNFTTMANTDRNPMLSDDAMRDLIFPAPAGAISFAEKVRYFYEDLITKGELIVVQDVEYEDQCSRCGNDVLEVGGQVGMYCPGCAGRIVKDRTRIAPSDPPPHGTGGPQPDGATFEMKG